MFFWGDEKSFESLMQVLMRYVTVTNDYHTDAALLMVFLGKFEWRTDYLKNHLLPLPVLSPGHWKGWDCSYLVIPCQEIGRDSIIAAQSSSFLGSDPQNWS